MKIVSAHKTDIGQVYQRNDDYVWVDDAAGLYILADGMGGHEAGDVASSMTANSVGQAVAVRLAIQAHSPAQLKKLLTGAIENANEAVFEASQKAEQKRRMGTTIVLALVQESMAYISHAGDSRAYLIRGEAIRQLTEDDSWGAQFASSGVDVAQSEQGRFDHFLTKSVGQEEMLDPSFLEVELKPDDWILLCSDGLWNMVGNDAILAELQQAGDDPAPVVENLVAAANQAGGRDNISVVVIKALP
jgi:serine/threonine protein phosphatase PrpC